MNGLYIMYNDPFFEHFSSFSIYIVLSTGLIPQDLF